MPLATRLTTLAALLLAAGIDAGSSKLPADPATEHLHSDCWVPDYCEPEKFKYKLCKLRLRGRAPRGASGDRSAAAFSFMAAAAVRASTRFGAAGGTSGLARQQASR